MKLKLYPNKGVCLALILQLLFVAFASAQNCSTLVANYATTESRCTATGSILCFSFRWIRKLQLSGIRTGYNQLTSSSLITGLPAGTYTVTVKDITTNCILTSNSVVVAGTYSDPRFGLIATDVTCANGNDGTVTVDGLANGRNPFLFTIVAPSASNLGTSNTTGFFTGLTPGDYSIQLRDSCGGIQTRVISVLNYSWSFDAVSVTKIGCDSADISVAVRDNKGRTNASGSAFSGFRYGVIRAAGDTVWSATRNFRVLKNHLRTLVIVAVDHCGAYHYSSWTDNSRPVVGAGPSISNRACSTFTATVVGQQFLTNPSYCIYNSAMTQIQCNTTGVFNNLPYGAYTITTEDNCYDTVISRSFTSTQPVPNISATVSITNHACSTFTATVTGQSNLYSPVFNLYDDAGTIVATNSTGIFTNVPYGTYSITATDGCTGQVFTRNFEVVPPIPTIGTITRGGFGCSGFNINIGSGTNQTTPEYCLYDTTGALIACNSTGIFNGIAYGNYCVRMSNLCRDTVITRCLDATTAPLPTVSAPAFSNQACSTFTAAVTGTNLNNPTVCIYDVNDVMMSCEPSGRFDNLPYGTYTIRLTNSAGCYDTTIVRTFTVNQPVPTRGALIIDSRTCSNFRVAMNAGTNLNNPTYYIFDLSNNEIATNATGIFTLPYGSYQMRVVNTCYDTTMIALFSESPAVNTVNISTTPSCTMGLTNISVTFTSGTAPYAIAIYDPWGNLRGSGYGSTTTFTVNGLPGLGGGLQYRVVSKDDCGGLRSTFVTPVSSFINKNIITNSKCPSGLWQNGSGDITVTANSNYGAVTPRIINRDGTTVNIPYSSGSGGVYTFNSMQPATYIIEYAVPTCSNRVYDTFQLQPYAYPELQQSAAYQCDNNSFSVGASVTGGVGPFNYEIIGSYPTSPSIVTASQANPVFALNNGTKYSLIRLRSVDACGNATLNDVSILPLANTIIQQAANCFYNNITLNVDTIPNANYEWFKMTGPNDSVLLGSGPSYDIPYLTPSDTGMYVAKASVNGGCLTQLSYFNVTDYCGVILSSKITLNGKKINGLNQLSWAADNEEETKEYIIERSTATSGVYQAIARVKAKKAGKSLYFYTDNQSQDLQTMYRVKVVFNANKVYHSNTVTFKPATTTGVTFYPNPVRDQLNISISNKEAQSLKVSILTVTGQVISENVHQNVLNTTIKYIRPATVKPGVYVLKINNLKTGEVTSHKVMFE